MKRESGGGIVLGVGSPMMDLLARVPESFLNSVPGQKGGMEWVTPQEMDVLLSRLPEPPCRAPGGSAANTVCALARLGMPVGLLGKMGMDAEAEAYRQAFCDLGGCNTFFRYSPDKPTGRCLSLITPDGERTMRTDLGAARFIDREDVSPEDFDLCRHVHMEGYALYNPDFVRHVLHTARSRGCSISMDLGSFEVVKEAQSVLPNLLRDYVDIVFANEEEARAFCSDTDPEKGLETLAACCPVAAVKLGAKGALIQQGQQQIHVDAVRVDHPVDTTGAGDCWAAGFLYGYLNGLSLYATGKLAALIGAETVSCLGASPNEQGWQRICSRVNIT